MALLSACTAIAHAPPAVRLPRSAPRTGLLSGASRARPATTPRVVRVAALSRRTVDKSSHITAAILPIAAAVALIIDPAATCAMFRCMALHVTPC
jgi:hypothetical protein